MRCPLPPIPPFPLAAMLVALGALPLAAGCGSSDASADALPVKGQDTKAQALDQTRDFSFVLLADTHYDYPQDATEAIAHDVNGIEGLSYPGETETVSNVKGVLIAGDLTDFGSSGNWHGGWKDVDFLLGHNYAALFGGGYQDTDFTRSDYSVFVHWDSDSVKYSIYEGFGNHDLTNGDYVPERIAERNHRYRNPLDKGALIRPDVLPDASADGYYGWTWNGIHFVNLNCFAGTPYTDTSQSWHAAAGLAWLKRHLETYVGDSGMPVVLMQHFEYVWTVNETGSIWWSREDRLRLKDVLAPYNVVAVLAGHRHYSGFYDVAYLRSPPCVPGQGCSTPYSTDHDIAYQDELPDQAWVVRAGAAEGTKDVFPGGSYIVARVKDTSLRFYLRARETKSSSALWSNSWFRGVPLDPSRTRFDITSRELVNWAPGEPNNTQGNEDCVEVRGATGQYNDIPCGLSRRFACRKGNAWTVSALALPWRDPDYDSTAVCPVGWVFDTPRDDAHDAIPGNGQLEDVAALRAALGNTGSAWVRLTDQGVEGRFEKRSHPRDFRPIFAPWAPGRPDNSHGDEDCAVLGPDNLYEDVSCMEAHLFACRTVANPRQWTVTASPQNWDDGVRPSFPDLDTTAGTHQPASDWPNPLLGHADPCPTGSYFSAPSDMTDLQTLAAIRDSRGLHDAQIYVRLSDAKREGTFELSVVDRAPERVTLVGANGCLTVDPFSQAATAACDGSAGQTWEFTPDGQLRQPGSNDCLTVTGQSPLEQVYLGFCWPGSANQRWILADGRLVTLSGGTPACLASGNGTPGDTQVSVTSCAAELPRLHWMRGAERARRWSQAGEFGTGSLVTAPALMAHSFSLGDVDGDGFPDACGRQSDGIHCTRHSGGSAFRNSELWSSLFTATGWSNPENGSTVQYPDVNHDGRADVCARGPEGIWCALSNGSSFDGAWVWTSDFSDAQGSNVLPSYYLSIHFADVDGDGWVDVCGRRPSGVYCGLNNHGGGFTPATAWMTGSFSDDTGWMFTQYGSTLQLGDINGDERADVCAHGAYGIVCSLSDGTRFLPGPAGDAPVWSSGSDFAGGAWDSDPSWYGSIRLADIDGDRRADVCGRTASGVVCGLSTGTGFAPVRAYTQGDFTDAAGWSHEDWATSLAFADLDRDGRAELCGRYDYGTVCARQARNPAHGMESEPSLVSRSGELLDVLYRNPGGALGISEWRREGWLAPLSLGSGLSSGVGCSGRRGTNELWCLTRSSSGALVQLTWDPLSGWSPLVVIADDPYTNPISTPSVMDWDDGRIHAFYAGPDEELRHWTWNGTWHGPENLGVPPIGSLKSAPACQQRRGSGYIDCFVRSNGNTLWYRTWTGSAWAGWANNDLNVPGAGADVMSAPSVTSWSPTRVDIFYRGPDDDLRQRVWTGTAWYGPYSLGAPPGGIADAPSCVARNTTPSTIDCVARAKADDVLYQRTWTGLFWTDWSAVAP